MAYQGGRGTQSEAFRAWFTGSRVVDGEGQPLVMYHGTRAEFQVFYPGDRETIHFTCDPKVASTYAMERPLDYPPPEDDDDEVSSRESEAETPNVVPVYLAVRNPFDPESEQHRELLGGLVNLSGDWEALEHYSERIKALGFDGIFVDGMRDVAVFDGGQVMGVFSREEDVAAALAMSDRRRAEQTESDQFKRWFADSKVVDAHGKPLVVYHGTKGAIEVFTVAPIYFTPDAGAASEFAKDAKDPVDYGWTLEGTDVAPNVMPVYLSIKRPKVMDQRALNRAVGSDGGVADWSNMDSLAEELEEKGYDGIHLVDVIDFDGYNERGEVKRRKYDQWIAFRPEQVKSAIGNVGEFNPQNPDIRHSETVATARSSTAAPVLLDNAPVTGIHPAAAIADLLRSPRFAGQTSREINRGDCDVFAGELLMRIGGSHFSTDFDGPGGEPSHEWVELNGRAYDAETPEGVAGWRELPIFIRHREQVARRNREALIGTAMFRRWFGASKVVDAEGKPLVVYHGTTADFSEFGNAESGGFFFSDDPKAAAEYAGEDGDRGQIMPTYLRMSNPFYSSVDEFEAFLMPSIEEIQRRGHDGLVILGHHDATTYAVFRPEQIKSAIGNDGTFDPGNPDIRYRDTTVGEVVGEVGADGGGEDLRHHNVGSDVTASPAFRAWFQGSVVVDEGGEPMRLYHGTGADTGDVIRPGTFFTARPDVADIYATAPTRLAADGAAGPNVVPVYLRIAHPYVHDDAGTKQSVGWALLGRRARHQEVIDHLRALGHDGLLIRNYLDLGGVQDQWVIFEPQQVKSATGNDGAFDPSNPNILHRNQDASAAEPAGTSSREEALRAWFGNSKIVDEEGEPLVVYHGTGQDIFSFQVPAWFSDSTRRAGIYARWTHSDTEREAPRVYPVYLAMSNPLVLRRLLNQTIPSIEREDIERAQGKGHDGIVYEYEAADGYPAERAFVIFSPEQAKSAVGNHGAFDPLSPNILFSQPQAERVAITQTPAFEAWFKGSAAVDERGDALVLYHGTGNDFSKFNTRGVEGGAFFTRSAYAASMFAQLHQEMTGEEDSSPAVYPVYLSVANPLRLDADEVMSGEEHNFDRMIAAIKRAKAAGHDGLLIRDTPDMGVVADQWVAFRPSQIKSALGNDGAFRPLDRDIRRREADEVRSEVAARSNAFDVWFEGSKVVDADGKALVTYHVTPHEFNEFVAQPGSDFGFHFGSAEAAREHFEDMSPSRQARARTLPVFLRITNPIRLPDMGDWNFDNVLDHLGKVGAVTRDEHLDALGAISTRAGREVLRDLLQAKGYDGIVYTNAYEAKGSDSYIAFDPAQIKSALGNSGAFDPANPDIAFRDRSVRRPRPKVEESLQFLRWFEGSHARDAAGQPLVLYHGSPRPDAVDAFKPDVSGGIYFTDSTHLANAYAYGRGFNVNPFGGAVIPVYLAMRNPLVIDACGKRHDNIPVPWQEWKPKVFGNLPKGAVSVRDAVERAIAQGHDGLIVRDVVDTPQMHDKTKSSIYVVFSPQQVKSALGNDGTFDPNHPGMLRRETDVVASQPPLAVHRTEAFARWFGASEVVDSAGAPLVVYHGTAVDRPIEAFDESERGIWFTEEPEEADSYAYFQDETARGRPHVMPVFLAIRNAYRPSEPELRLWREATACDEGFEEIERRLVAKAKALGHDGLCLADHSYWVAFEATQVKSALGNTGDFDPTAIDIRLREAGNPGGGAERSPELANTGVPPAAKPLAAGDRGADEDLSGPSP